MDKKLLKISGWIFLSAFIWFFILFLISGFSLQWLFETIGYNLGYFLGFFGIKLIPILLLISLIFFIIGLFKK